jgi:hypothetical protein
MRSLHTPQQETNSAYNPGVTFQGGQFLAQGISQAGNAITEGLQRYAAQKAEDQFVTQRVESLGPSLQKFAQYENLADENGPAAKLAANLSNFTNLPLAKKKAVLVDAEQFIGQKEQEQRRKEAKQDKLLEIQDRQAQFDELKKYRQSELSRNLGNDAWRMGTDIYDRFRNARTDDRLERSTALAEKREQDVLARQAAADKRAAEERAALSGFASDISRFASQDYQPGSGTGAVRPMPLNEASLAAFARNPAAFGNPNADNMLAAIARMQPKPAWSPSVQVVDGVRFGTTSPSSAQVLPGAPPPTAPLPIVPGFTPVPTGEPGRVQWLKTAAPNGTEPDRETLGRIAQLEELLRQEGGQDFAFDYNNTAGYSTSRFWDDGKSAKAELARLRGMTGGVPASGPAAAAAPDLKPGDERKGYIYQGGDPSKPESWRKK